MQISRPGKQTTIEQVSVAAYKETPLDLPLDILELTSQKEDDTLDTSDIFFEKLEDQASKFLADTSELGELEEFEEFDSRKQPPSPKPVQHSAISAMKISRGKIDRSCSLRTKLLPPSLDSVIQTYIQFDLAKDGNAFDQWSHSKARHKADKTSVPQSQNEREFKKKFRTLDAAQIALMDPKIVSKTLTDIVKSELAFQKWTRKKDEERYVQLFNLSRQNEIEIKNDEKVEGEEKERLQCKAKEIAKRRKADELRQWAKRKDEEDELRKQTLELKQSIETRKVEAKKSKVLIRGLMYTGCGRIRQLEETE
jgi:hypothetical protein